MKKALMTLLCLFLLAACTSSTEGTLPTPTESVTEALSFEVLLPPNAIVVLDQPATVTVSEAETHIGLYEEVEIIQLFMGWQTR